MLCQIFLTCFSFRLLKFGVSGNYCENTTALQEFSPAGNLRAVHVHDVLSFPYGQIALGQVLASYKKWKDQECRAALLWQVVFKWPGSKRSRNNETSDELYMWALFVTGCYLFVSNPGAGRNKAMFLRLNIKLFKCTFGKLDVANMTDRTTPRAD